MICLSNDRKNFVTYRYRRTASPIACGFMRGRKGGKGQRPTRHIAFTIIISSLVVYYAHVYFWVVHTCIYVAIYMYVQSLGSLRWKGPEIAEVKASFSVFPFLSSIVSNFPEICFFNFQQFHCQIQIYIRQSSFFLWLAHVIIIIIFQLTISII